MKDVEKGEEEEEAEEARTCSQYAPTFAPRRKRRK